MHKKLALLIFPIALFLATGADCQPPAGASGSIRARRAFEKALQAYQAHDYQLALSEAERALSRDPNYLDANILKAEVLFNIKDYTNSALAYQQVIRLDPSVYPQSYFYLGYSLLKTGGYQEASDALNVFLAYPDKGTSLTEKARQLLRNCAFALDAIANPVMFKPENPGPAINTENAEYSPAITADGKTMVFTRRSRRDDPSTQLYGPEIENFFISHLRNGVWSVAEDLGPPINTQGNEGAQSISADGRELYFTACNRPGATGSCDIYYARRTGDTWSLPVNLGPVVNSTAWDSQPSVSGDGKSLYFASARRSGQGDMDIWMTTLGPDGKWLPPENLGAVINTPGKEMSPFIHPDNQTLYFASDGHTGMGGLDLFVSRRDAHGQWTNPENLGYPVNTYADEFSLVVDAGATQAFFAADREGGFGNMDIYAFELHAGVKPQPMTYMKGKVYDAITGAPLAASLELIDLESGLALHKASSDPVNGNFLVTVPVHINMALHVSARGYLFFSENLNYKDVRGMADPYLADIPLKTVRAGESMVLRNIFYETGSFELHPESRTELDRLAVMLKENPVMHIEIGGHTDNVGSYMSNVTLSANRAESVVKYLIEAGIDPSRISFNGYADTRPVDTNDTETGRARNRRTEFIIVEP